MSARPTGSSADVGSSRMTSAGSPRSATPRPRRCCMPFENVSTFASACPLRPTVASAPDICADPLGASESREPAVQREHLARAQPALIAEQLRAGSRSGCGSARSTGTCPEYPRLAAGWSGEAEEQLDRRGLAAAVRSEETEHLAARHDHGEAGQRDGRTVVLRQLERPDCGLILCDGSCRADRHQCNERAMSSAGRSAELFRRPRTRRHCVARARRCRGRSNHRSGAQGRR